MNKPIPIIQNPQTGIAISPELGFGDMRNMDVSSKEGIARISNQLKQVSDINESDLVVWFTKNPLNSSQVWALGNTNRVYRSTDNGSTWTYIPGNNPGSGQGAIVFNDYLIVARTSTLDIYGPLSGSPSWLLSWQNIDSDLNYHPMIISKNDSILYGGSGRTMFTIAVAAGTTFDPTSGGTYTFTKHGDSSSRPADLFIIPENYRISCLSELGQNILIGTVTGNNLHDFKNAFLVQWDRSSITFESPMTLEENGVQWIMVINNLAYIYAGLQGKIYESNGVQISEIAQLPQSIIDITGGKSIFSTAGGVMNFNGKICFTTASTTLTGGIGVWSLDVSRSKPILNLEYTFSPGNDGTLVNTQGGAIFPVSEDTFLAGWFSNGYGIDQLDNNSRYSNYSAYIDSPLATVGSNKAKRMLKDIEFILAGNLASGQGVKLAFRRSLTDSFTTIGTYDFATLGAIISHNVASGIPRTESIQIRCYLTTADNTSPELKMVTLS